MDLLATAAIFLAMLPGSLLFVGVCVWTLLNRVAGLKKPPLPLHTPDGALLYTEEQWRQDTREEYPVRYAVFEQFPIYLRGLWRRVKRAIRPRSVREQILQDAFTDLVYWARTHQETSGFPAADERLAEIRDLYYWWTQRRPILVKKVDESDKDMLEFNQVDLMQEDEHSFARLANVWRTLT